MMDGWAEGRNLVSVNAKPSGWQGGQRATFHGASRCLEGVERVGLIIPLMTTDGFSSPSRRKQLRYRRPSPQ